MTGSWSSVARSILLALGVVALPVAYVLSVYLDQGVVLATGVRAALVTAVAAAVVVMLASLLLRDSRRGALVGACVIAVVFLWFIPALALLFALLAGAVVVDGLLAGRTGRVSPRDVRWLHGALGGFGLLLLSLTLVQFGLRGQVVLPAPPRRVSGPDRDSTRPVDHRPRWVPTCGRPAGSLGTRQQRFPGSAGRTRVLRRGRQSVELQLHQAVTHGHAQHVAPAGDRTILELRHT